MRKKDVLKSVGRRILAMALSAALGLSLIGCGSEGEQETPKKEWAYVPEFLTLDAEEVSFWDMKAVGDYLYYSSYTYDEETGAGDRNICRYSLVDRQMTTVSLAWPEDVLGGKGINDFMIGGDGSVYITNSEYNMETGSSKLYLHKFDKDGKYVYGIEPKDPKGSDQFWVQEMAADDQGRMYLYGGGSVLLYDGEGKSKGTLSLGTNDTYIEKMSLGTDGKVYIVYSSFNGNSTTTQMGQADFEGAKIETSQGSFPSNVRSFVMGTEGKFLINDGGKVHEYDLGTQQKTELFDWLDCDINGNYVETFGQMTDGRFVAVVRDWELQENEVVLLTKVKASEVAQKENIVVGTLYGGYELRSLAVSFNKASDKYHVSIREYMNYEKMDENSFTDAIASMNNDITSGNCPDVIDLSGMNVSQLSSKGVFEDLEGYLEESSALKLSDFLENVVEAYTYDDKLIGIPSSFTLQTLVGHKSKIGDKKGWTLDEMIAYADENSDKDLFDRVSKGEILQTLIMRNQDAFMDWSTGECNFNTDEFKSLLEFANRFPDEVDWDSDAPVTPIRIQNGEVLLDIVHISEFNSIQESLEMFKNDLVCIGYPTADGSSGHVFNGRNAYAIASKSKCKDGAWEFIESILTREENERNRNGFPVLKDKLNALAQKAVEIQYATDENGELWLDENGDPIISNSGGGIGWGDWFYEYHVPTQEEVDLVLEVIKTAKPMNYTGSDEILNIILEDAEPYFQGQKSVDEVAGIIQNRVGIYINENR